MSSLGRSEEGIVSIEIDQGEVAEFVQGEYSDNLLVARSSRLDASGIVPLVSNVHVRPFVEQ